MDRKLLVGMSVLALLLTLWFCLPRGYGKISPKAYDLALASYSACVARSEERIDKIDLLLNEDATAQNLSRQEFQWFTTIIEQARSQHWETAAMMAKQMLLEQIEVQL